MFNGYCTQCQTSVNGILLKSRDEDEEAQQIGFQIETFAVQNVEHTGKRKFANQARRDGKIILRNKYATDHREDIQKERMQDRSREPANLHDSGIYQTARQEARD